MEPFLRVDFFFFHPALKHGHHGYYVLLHNVLSLLLENWNHYESTILHKKKELPTPKYDDKDINHA
jgi:hypothetical protein